MLKDKVCIITGGARGIGKAIAIKMAQGGANIAILDFGDADAAVKECESLGVKAQYYHCDVSSFEQSGEVVKQVIADFGRVDILVNNAGITRDNLILTMPEEDFDSVINVNLKGTFNMTKHVTRPFIRQKGGKIINLASIAGIDGNRGQVNYSASKAGVIGMTKTLAKELGAKNICVNAIAPGCIATDMTKDMLENPELTANIPLKRAGLPEEVASLAAFLATSDYITGEVIRIDGGMTL